MTMTISGNGTITGSTAPCFSAQRDSLQSGISSGVWTKVLNTTENFDPANCYDTTNCRFTPNVPGYYQVNGIVYISGTGTYGAASSIYKNGSLYCWGSFLNATSGSIMAPVSDLIYMNGTTDYIELWGIGTVTVGTLTFSTASGGPSTRFSASLVRSA